MKKLNKYNRTAGYLEKIFDLINEEYFNGELPKVVITIQNTPKAYGHFTPDQVWEVEDGMMHEINIGAETVNRQIDEVVGILVHEMVHLYCHIHGIRDTSRSGTYHNKDFKKEAEKRDLIIVHDKKIGWSITSPSENLINFCIRHELTDVQMGRINKKKMKPATVSHSRKYVCPCCRDSARTTKDKQLICGDCKEIMKLAI